MAEQTFGFMDGSQYNVQGQQLKPASSPVPTATVPPPSVVTSQPARQATQKNVGQLSMSEQMLQQPAQVSPTALQSVYGKRSDLQALYNPDGTAKDPNNPSIAGVPTLQDWASKYGSQEEESLKPFQLNIGNTGSPATDKVVETINTKLKAALEADGFLSPADQELLQKVQSTSDSELPLLSQARSAADNEDYRSLNKLMEQVQTLRNDRTAMTSKLLESLNMGETERAYTERLKQQVQGSRSKELEYEKEQLDIENKVMPMIRIQLQQASGEKYRILERKAEALEQMATAENLQALTQQRQLATQTLTTALELNQQDITNTLGIAAEFRQIAKEQRDEARQTIGDIIQFSDGKSFTELDDESKAAVIEATANSPITLGMVRNALGSANRAFAKENGIAEPFFFAPDGKTIISAQTGEAFTNEQEFFEAGGAQDFSNVGVPRVAKYTKDQIFGSPEEGYSYIDPYTGEVTEVTSGDMLTKYKRQLEIQKLENDLNGVVPPQDAIKYETDLRKEFNGLAVVKEYNTVNQSYNNINSAYSEAVSKGKDGKSKAAADQVLIVAFNKMIDPNSVVRETEFARSTEGQSIMNRLKGKADQALQGGVALSDEDRKAIVDATAKLYQSYQKSYANTANEYRGYAQDYGVDPDRVVKGETPTLSQLMQVPEYRDAVREMQKAGVTDLDVIYEALTGGTSSLKGKGGISATSPIAPVARKYPEGYNGGQCGDFAHKIVEFPSVGDSKAEKIKSIQKYGIPASQWRRQARAGDVVITGENPTYGHVFVINEILPNGKARVTESNYKQSNKVSHDRIISLNDPIIYGAIRGQLKI